jgi:sigma-B regulation protein RsbQ
MTLQNRHNIQVLGRGTTAMVFAHGYGCDQNMTGRPSW